MFEVVLVVGNLDPPVGCLEVFDKDLLEPDGGRLQLGTTPISSHLQI